MSWRVMFRPGMRAYFIPLVAGIVLAISAFLPWVVIAGTRITGMSGVVGVQAIIIVVLGALAALLATLSLITRRNSRHPLLLVGLVALGIMFLMWRLLPRSIGEGALIRSEAYSIVEDRPLDKVPDALVGSGIYLGLAAACVIVGFGLTIVLKRASTPYVVSSPDDDV